MKYFKITHGYNPNDYISIDESELQKALYCHLTGANAVFNEGSVSGKSIITIKEDWHRAMGYNEGHKLDAEDMLHIKQKLGNIYTGVIGEAREYVKHLIETKQTHLIGKNQPPKIEPQINEISASISNKFRI